MCVCVCVCVCESVFVPGHRWQHVVECKGGECELRQHGQQVGEDAAEGRHQRRGDDGTTHTLLHTHLARTGILGNHGVAGVCFTLTCNKDSWVKYVCLCTIFNHDDSLDLRLTWKRQTKVIICQVIIFKSCQSNKC